MVLTKYYENDFAVITKDFVDAITDLLDNWDIAHHICQYDWFNETIQEMAENELYGDYYEDDVDESDYDPYMGCNFYEPYDYVDW